MLNTAAAIGVGLATVIYYGRVYDWITNQGLLYQGAVLAVSISGALTFVSWVSKRWGRVAGTWATLVAVWLVIAIFNASGDSIKQQHHNCWRLSGNDSNQTVACAPSNVPVDDGYCEYLRDGDAGVGIWRCSYVDVS